MLAAASGGKAAFEGPAWNSCTADMVRAAKAHAYLVLQTNFFERVHGLQQQARALAWKALQTDCGDWH